MVVYYLCGLLPSFQSTRMILRNILCVAEVWTLTWSLYHLDLTRIASQLAMFSPTSEGEVEPIIEHYCVEECLWRGSSKESLLPKKVFLCLGEHFRLPLLATDSLALKPLHLTVQGCSKVSKVNTLEKVKLWSAIPPQMPL